MRLGLILPMVALASCKYVGAADKVAALEQRVNALAADVAELGGHPADAAPSPQVGPAPGHAPEPAVAHHDAEPGHPGPPATAGPDHAAATAGHPTAHWGYQGDVGPDRWSTLDPAFEQCAIGAQQSPIDILPRPASAEAAAAPDVLFIYRPTAGEVVDNGHTLQVNLARGSYAMVDGARYDLVQFHVHTPSEHTVAGDQFPMEVHLVHRDHTGHLAVLGVLFAEGEPSAALAPMWKAAPRHAGTAKLKRSFDPSALLPRDRRAYRYDGSLTTPPCSEGVEWIVLRRTRTETEGRIAAFRTRFGANARPPRPVGARAIE